MARINIEEEAHKRVSKLAGLANCSDREALGTVSFLWGDSQDILKTHGSRDEIIEWAHLFNLSVEEADKWISALEKSRFISCLNDGQYLIHGNKVQIETRVSNLRRATKGAKATKKKWSEMKRLGAGLKKASSTLGALEKQTPSATSQANASQANASQANASQANASQANARQANASQANASQANARQAIETVGRKRPPIPTTGSALLELIPIKTRSEYRELYPVPGWIEREAIKAIQWCERNPKKRPRTLTGYLKFFAGWLDRGWQTERRNIPSEKSNGLNKSLEVLR